MQVDMTILEVDQLDANTLACIVGQNPEGELPVQQPLPRLRQLLAQSHQLIALVSDPSKVFELQSAATRQPKGHTLCAADVDVNGHLVGQACTERQSSIWWAGF